MRWIDILSQSLASMFRRKLRSALTILGVMIGTAAIIVTISLGYGAEAAQMEALQEATNLRMISVYPFYGGEEAVSGRRVTRITDQVLANVRRIAHVAAVTPVQSIYFSGSSQILDKDGRYRCYADLLAVYPRDFARMQELKSGRYFSGRTDRMEFIMSEMVMAGFEDTKAKNAEYVDVWSLMNEGKELPLPKISWFREKFQLEISWYDYEHYDQATGEYPSYTRTFPARMVGSVPASLNGGSFTYSTIVSIDWLKRWVRENRSLAKELNLELPDSYDDVSVMADDVDNVEEVVRSLKEMGLQCYSPIEYINTYKEQIRTMQNFLGFIGAISMLVAALSIANTMMMSIYERTREIGVMKVLGCRLGNIRALFLTEAACIGLFGGLLGLGASYALSYALNNVPWLREVAGSVMSTGSWLDGGSGVISIIPLNLALSTWGFVVAVALASGFYPAQRAMRLSSLAAIRNND